jgi:hypothetical protein
MCSLEKYKEEMILLVTDCALINIQRIIDTVTYKFKTKSGDSLWCELCETLKQTGNCSDR